MMGFFDHLEELVRTVMRDGRGQDATAHVVQSVRREFSPDIVRIQIVSGNIDVEIRGHESEGMLFELKSFSSDDQDHLAFSLKELSGNLVVQTEEGRCHNASLYVTVPQRKLNMTVVTRDGDVSILNVVASDIDIQTATADVHVADSSCDKLCVRTRDGDIFVRNVKANNPPALVSNTGDVLC